MTQPSTKPRFSAVVLVSLRHCNRLQWHRHTCGLDLFEYLRGTRAANTLPGRIHCNSSTYKTAQLMRSEGINTRPFLSIIVLSVLLITLFLSLLRLSFVISPLLGQYFSGLSSYPSLSRWIHNLRTMGYLPPTMTILPLMRRVSKMGSYLMIITLKH
jgi:hypothetical protein